MIRTEPLTMPFSSGMLDGLMRAVRAFHHTFGHPAPVEPVLQDEFHVDRRIEFIGSECVELKDAKTIAQQADAYLDIIYFAAGGLVELGIDPTPLMDLTHEANMAKVWPDGELHKDPTTGKTLKPPGWEDPTPKQEAEVQAQIAANAKLRVLR